MIISYSHSTHIISLFISFPWEGVGNFTLSFVIFSFGEVQKLHFFIYTSPILTHFHFTHFSRLSFSGESRVPSIKNDGFFCCCFFTFSSHIMSHASRHIKSNQVISHRIEFSHCTHESCTLSHVMSP